MPPPRPRRRPRPGFSLPVHVHDFLSKADHASLYAPPAILADMLALLSPSEILALAPSMEVWNRPALLHRAASLTGKSSSASSSTVDPTATGSNTLPSSFFSDLLTSDDVGTLARRTPWTSEDVVYGSS
uniref:Uncharacterized protein n=1 Tax=Zea mays TaxID=4577 RepID=A0A804QPI5_MAIZE